MKCLNKSIALPFLLIAYPMCSRTLLTMRKLAESVRQLSESRMHTEEQKQQALTPPELPPPSESGESKSAKRGGKRPGAGRKPNLAKRLLKGFSRDAIAEAMSTIDVGMVVTSLLKSKREKTRLEALIFVRDTLIGRPAQNVQFSGGVLHAHAWRPLASLSDEEVELLDKLTKKLAGPVLDVAQDAPQNQIESKPAIEAEVVDSEAPNA